VAVANNIKRLLRYSTDNWRTELTADGKVSIRRRIFQGDSLSPLRFVIAMSPLTHILRQHDAGYRLGDGHRKINHLLFMDDLKLYGKNDREMESLVHTARVFREGIGMQ